MLLSSSLVKLIARLRQAAAAAAADRTLHKRSSVRV
jgi:hypothetical protein